MNIIRAEITDTDIFSKDKLKFGACCFFTEDRKHSYHFKINGQEATLYTDTKQYIPQAIEEFLFYSSFVATVKDEGGHALATRNPCKPYLCEIANIQPSQFFINQTKLECCKMWISCPEDIFIPIAVRDGKNISLDGHTRMKAALDLGYTCVYVYPDEYDNIMFHFADEAIKRKVNSVADMEIISAEDYEIKWNKFCDDLFKRLEGEGGG